MTIPFTGKRRRHRSHQAKHGRFHRNFERTVAELRARGHYSSHITEYTLDEGAEDMHLWNKSK